MQEIGLKLFKFQEKKSGLYFFITIPEIGLHLSLHGISENNIHIHIKDKIGLGIHENIPEPDNLYTEPEEWLKDFAKFLYRPARDSMLLVVPMPVILEPNQWGISLSKGEFRIDLFRALPKFSEHFARHAHFMRPKDLPNHISRLAQQKATAFDITQQKLVTFHKSKDIPFMFGYKIEDFKDQWKGTKIWENLFLPMDKAVSYAKQKRPDAFEKWGIKDIQALEDFYSDKLDSISALIEQHLKRLLDKRVLN